MALQQFDPNRHISKINGQDYLEVKWRLAWMRREHPDATIATTMVSLDDRRAVVRAEIVLPEGGSASGHGSETAQGFEDYIEKAETRAIGRALAALGYGTPLNDESATTATSRSKPPATRESTTLATAPQRHRIQRIATELGLDQPALAELIRQHANGSLDSISKRQASGLIDLLESRKPAAVAGKAS